MVTSILTSGTTTNFYIKGIISMGSFSLLCGIPLHGIYCLLLLGISRGIILRPENLSHSKKKKKNRVNQVQGLSFTCCCISYNCPLVRDHHSSSISAWHLPDTFLTNHCTHTIQLYEVGTVMSSLSQLRKWIN